MVLKPSILDVLGSDGPGCPQARSQPRSAVTAHVNGVIKRTVDFGVTEVVSFNVELIPCPTAYRVLPNHRCELAQMASPLSLQWAGGSEAQILSCPPPTHRMLPQKRGACRRGGVSPWRGLANTGQGALFLAAPGAWSCLLSPAVLQPNVVTAGRVQLPGAAQGPEEETEK